MSADTIQGVVGETPPIALEISTESGISEGVLTAKLRAAQLPVQLFAT